MITSDIELKKGDLVLWWSGVFGGWVQWFFTRRGKRFYDQKKRSGKKSHHSKIYGIVNGKLKDIDVTTKVKLSDFSINTKAGLWIYRIKDVPEHLINDITDWTWEKYKNRPYAFLQWETYPSRWLFEIIYKYKFLYYPFGWLWHSLHGFKDARRWGTVFPKEVVCSEGTLYQPLLRKLCPEMIARGDERFKRLQKRLEEWSGNKFHSTDCEVIYDDFPDIFELIYYKTRT